MRELKRLPTAFNQIFATSYHLLIWHGMFTHPAHGCHSVASSCPRTVNTPPYILSVDDEEAVTDLIAFNLRRENYDVNTASNGRKALELIAQRRPDLLLLDLMLPDLDGFAICEMLRRRAETVDLPIVIISAWDEPDTHQLGLELGAIDFLNKPFSPRLLVELVNKLLRGCDPIRPVS